jgi:hypothetical protein
MEVGAARQSRAALLEGHLDPAVLPAALRVGDHRVADRPVVARSEGRRAEFLAAVVDLMTRQPVAHPVLIGPTPQRPSKGKELSL